MTLLTNYRQFEGRHWDTGTVRNTPAHLGVIAPLNLHHSKLVLQIHDIEYEAVKAIQAAMN